MNVDKLTRMANQIAANFDYGPDKDKVAASVVDHLKRFWTPTMRAAIIESYERGGPGLSDIAKRAIAKLAEQETAAA